jgi:hypothetical protein
MEDRQERACKLIEIYLSKIFGSLRVYRENHKFLIPWGFSAINVFVYRGEEEIFVGINAPVALRVPNKKELLQFLLAENNSLMGCAFSVEFEGDVLDILLGIKLRFADLTKENLELIALNIGNLANEYGSEIIAVFGGITFKEYVEKETLKGCRTKEKLLHDYLELDGKEIAFEMYTLEEGEYLLVVSVSDEESSKTLISARRSGEPSEVFRLLEDIKDAIAGGDFGTLRSMLKGYEIDAEALCVVMRNCADRINRLRDAERRIDELSNQLIRGEISHKEYKKRLSDIEREFGLQD